MMSPQAKEEEEEEETRVAWHRGKYWRIAGKYYDFTPFMDRHPGGRTLLEIARDAYDDSTFAFEAHHTNYMLVRKMLPKYEVKLTATEKAAHKAAERRTKKHPYPRKLIPEDSFYSVLRSNVRRHLSRNGGSGPTKECLFLFFICAIGYSVSFGLMYYSGNLVCSCCAALFGGLLGGFAHSWVHQPKFKTYAYAMDFIGLSSDGWLQEHVLQHHMYTNSPLDNHFEGTAPFLVTDPTVRRNLIQCYLTPFINVLLLQFGIWANHAKHLASVAQGSEELRLLPKSLLWVQTLLLVTRWGIIHGLLLMHVTLGLIGIWFFSVALLNHNSEKSYEAVLSSNKNVVDWAHAQLIACSDFEPNTGVYGSMKYLWLNYHTVHHLFPHVDLSKHAAVQTVLIDTIDTWNHGHPSRPIRYESHKSVWNLYREMITSFRFPRHPGAMLRLYPGI